MKITLFIALLSALIAGMPGCGAQSGVAPAGSGGVAAHPDRADTGGVDGSGGRTTAGSGGNQAAGSGGDGEDGGGAGDGATGGTDGATPDEQLGATAACASLAQALCAKAESCTPFATNLVFGTLATCEDRLQRDCLTRFMPGSSATPADTASCAAALPSQPCAAFARGDLGVACAIRPGSLPAAAACLDDRQCDTAFCARAPDAVCGVCAPVTAPRTRRCAWSPCPTP